MNSPCLLATAVLCLLSLAASSTTSSPDCADYTGTYAPCYRHDLICCQASELCQWSSNQTTCPTEGYANRGCCERTPSPTVAELTTSTSGSYPTPRPTMESARKWEMIHPQYDGSDGELLWQIYYGDFSHDDRFDGFRNNELWDADVIRPILQMDDEFSRYGNDDKEMAHESRADIPSSVAESTWKVAGNDVVWLVLLAFALLVTATLVYRYECKRNDAKKYHSVEDKPLVSHTKDADRYVF